VRAGLQAGANAGHATTIGDKLGMTAEEQAALMIRQKEQLAQQMHGSGRPSFGLGNGPFGGASHATGASPANGVVAGPGH
jgi:hypothetical protein